MNLKNDQDKVQFYKQTLCARADSVYQFALVLEGNQPDALKLVSQVFDSAVDDLPKYHSSSNYMIELLTTCHWIFKLRQTQNENKLSIIDKKFSELDVEKRASIYLIDLMGYSEAITETILKQSKEDLWKNLESAHKFLIKNS